MSHNLCFLLTRPDGGVSIVYPMREAIEALCRGDWRDRSAAFVQRQRRLQIEAGHDPQAVMRFCYYMVHGCTEDDAIAVICVRDCSHRGTGIEIVDYSAVPQDRWFRNAWRRAPEGGPIWIDLEAARTQQLQRIVQVTKAWNDAQLHSGKWGHNGPQLIDLDYCHLQRRCEAALDLAELRRVWPGDLPMQLKGSESA